MDITKFYDSEEFEMATKEELIQEATRRLQLLAEKYELHPKVLTRWETGLLCYSATTFWGQYAFANGQSFNSLPKETPAAEMLRIPKSSQFADIIQEYEKRTGALVYHAMKESHTLTLLSVSPYKSDWEEFDAFEFPEGVFCGYVHNFEAPQYSEHGSTRVCSSNGALIRIN